MHPAPSEIQAFCVVFGLLCFMMLAAGAFVDQYHRAKSERFLADLDEE